MGLLTAFEMVALCRRGGYTVEVTPEDRDRLAAGLDPTRFRVCGCPREEPDEPDGPCDQVLSVDGNYVQHGGGLCDFCRVMCLPSVFPEMVAWWKERLTASGFFVRGLTLEEGARLFVAAGVPRSEGEREEPRGFASMPRSNVFISKTATGWQIVHPGGRWEGSVPGVLGERVAG